MKTKDEFFRLLSAILKAKAAIRPPHKLPFQTVFSHHNKSVRNQTLSSLSKIVNNSDLITIPVSDLQSQSSLVLTRFAEAGLVLKKECRK